MHIVLVYSLILALLSALLAALTNSTGGAKAVVVGAIIASILAFFSEFLYLYFAMPIFAHWTSGGYSGSALIGLACVSLVTIFSAMSIDKYGNLGLEVARIVLLFTVLIVIFIAGGLGTLVAYPPAVLDNGFWDRTASLLNVRDATSEELELAATDDDLIKFSPRAANLEASTKLPPDVGSYTEVGNTFEQTVNGEQVYVTDLHVTNWRSFRQVGAVLPGYLVRPAKSQEADTQFVNLPENKRLRYVPSARFQYDLARHVYFEIGLTCGCQIEHLEVLEEDDEGNAVYTGTLWEYEVGAVGMTATGVIVVDPVDGSIVRYSLEDAPEWIDRIYSIEKFEDLVTWWATYSDWDAEWIETTRGKKKVDTIEDVYGHDGELYYMATITSAGSDQTLISEIRFSPRVGEAVLYPASGRTIKGVDDTIDSETFNTVNSDIGAEPVECERQLLLGRMTYYCLLENRSEGDSNGALMGYAFLQEQYSQSGSKVIIGRDFNDAWNKFRLQITQDVGDGDLVQSEIAEVIAIQGTLIRKADTVTDGKLRFILLTDDGQIWLQVDANNPIIALSKEGDWLEVTAFELDIDNINDVLSVLNRSIPPVTLTP